MEQSPFTVEVENKKPVVEIENKLNEANAYVKGLDLVFGIPGTSELGESSKEVIRLEAEKASKKHLDNDPGTAMFVNETIAKAIVTRLGTTEAMRWLSIYKDHTMERILTGKPSKNQAIQQIYNQAKEALFQNKDVRRVEFD